MNGDNQQINFTVADRVLLANIDTKLDDMVKLQTQVVRNTAWIKVFKWAIGSGGLVLGLRVFGVL